MLLLIGTRHSPATDLGYLLMKHPEKVQTFDLSYGKAHVFYPAAGEDFCQVGLLLDIDPTGLVRGRPSGDGLAAYVNDRPYVSSSLLSVALAQVFSSAMKGQSRSRPELAATAIPLEVEVISLPCRGGEKFLRGLFEPLGYAVEFERLVFDSNFPEWGESPYYHVRLRQTIRLSELLNHLYVLIPVLDNDKHYWVDSDEIEKLLDKGGEWLTTHPLREEITHRYLKRQRSLTRMALEKMSAMTLDEEPLGGEDEKEAQERDLEVRISLNEDRMLTIARLVAESSARSCLDLGCGEGRLLRRLLQVEGLARIVGVDVSLSTLDRARKKLHFDELPSFQRARLDLWQGSLVYRDARFRGFDIVTLIEVIEHLDLPRLGALERIVFADAKPRMALVSTPNVEYNALFPNLPAGRFRHGDHRFEWTRAEFENWARFVAARHNYSVQFQGIGKADSNYGSPTQLAIFNLN